MAKLSEKDNAGKTKVKYSEIRELAEAEEARRGYSMISTKESTKVNKIQGSSERKCFKCKGPFPGCGCSKSKKKGTQQKKPPSRPCSICGESHFDKKNNAGKTKVKYAEIRELAEAEEARRGYSMISTKESTKVNKIQGSSERKCFKCKGPFPGCGCSKSKKKGTQQKKPPSRPCSFCGESHYDTECPKFKKAFERDREWTKKKEKVSVVKVNLCQDGLNKIVDCFLLDGTKTKFMVDTGSKIDLINVEAWKSLKKPRLRKPDILIKGIGVQDKFIKCFGYMVSIIIDPETDKLVESKVYVIENDENILGLRSINGLEYLVVRKKKVIVSSTDILSKDEEQKFVDGLKQDYKDVFKPELGTLKVEPVHWGKKR
uniref:Peptidase A2 domain-containing protein n=1 Tax=Panagrolaimus sp. JU765 TaxID=591449 RepID=A0AC34RC08_9BILA